MRLLKIAEVKERTALSEPTIWRRIRDGSFPKPVRLGPKSVAWPETEIDQWIADLLAIRDREVA